MSAEDSRPDVATRIAEKTADTVLEKNQRHWSFDRRIPIIAVGTFMVAAIGYVYLFGEMRQSFADVVDNTERHEIRIRGLEIGLGQTNLEVSVVRGKSTTNSSPPQRTAMPRPCNVVSNTRANARSASSPPA